MPLLRLVRRSPFAFRRQWDHSRAFALAGEQPLNGNATGGAELGNEAVGKGRPGLVLFICALIQLKQDQHRALRREPGFPRGSHPADEGRALLGLCHPVCHSGRIFVNWVGFVTGQVVLDV